MCPTKPHKIYPAHLYIALRQTVTKHCVSYPPPHLPLQDFHGCRPLTCLHLRNTSLPRQDLHETLKQCFFCAPSPSSSSTLVITARLSISCPRVQTQEACFLPLQHTAQHCTETQCLKKRVGTCSRKHTNGKAHKSEGL